jgi:exosortase
VALLLGAGVLYLWGTYVAASDLLLVSLVGLVFGAILLCWGAGSARELALPLCIALFAVPMPAVLAHQIVFPLQLAVAAHTEALLGALGVTVDRSGDILFTATAAVQVIETCSGIRSMDVLTLLALVFVAFFQPGWRRGLVLVLAAPLIAYAINVMRVAWVVFRARGDVAPTGHVLEGLVVFAASVTVLMAFDAVLSRLLPTPEPERASQAPLALGRGPAGARYARAFAVVAGALALASVAMPRWHPNVPRSPRIELPAEVGPWRRMAAEERPWTPVSSGNSVARYELGGETVLFSLARDNRLRRDRSLLSPKNAVPGPGWEIERRWLAEPDVGGGRFQAVLAGSFASRSLTYSRYEGFEGLLSEVLRATFATDRSILRRPGEAGLLRLSTTVTPSARGATEAAARLEAFLRAWRGMHAPPR